MKQVTQSDIEAAERLKERKRINEEARGRCIDRIHAYEVEIARLLCPYELGDIIEYGGKRGVVSRVERHYSGWHIAFTPLKKDGTPSKIEKGCWDNDEIRFVGDGKAQERVDAQNEQQASMAIGPRLVIRTE